MIELLAQSSVFNSWSAGGIFGALGAIILLGGLVWSVIDSLLYRWAYRQEDRERRRGRR